MLALASSFAFADSISFSTELGTQGATGDIPGFAAPGDNSTSAAKWNAAASNSAIQAGCPTGYTCGAATLYEIDFTITGNLSSTVTISNTTGASAQIQPIGGQGGTFSHPSSGVAVDSSATLELSDPLSSDLVVTVPTFSISTNTEYKSVGGTGCTGTANKSSFINCLNVAAGSTTFSGPGTATNSGGYFSTDSTWATEAAAYTGSGDVNFTLTLTGSSTSGTLPTGVTIPTNIASIQALTDGLQVGYDYSFTETLNPSTPEPTTFVLFGGALVGLGLLGKRLKKG